MQAFHRLQRTQETLSRTEIRPTATLRNEWRELLVALLIVWNCDRHCPQRALLGTASCAVHSAANVRELSIPA